MVLSALLNRSGFGRQRVTVTVAGLFGLLSSVDETVSGMIGSWVSKHIWILWFLVVGGYVKHAFVVLFSWIVEVKCFGAWWMILWHMLLAFLSPRSPRSSFSFLVSFLSPFLFFVFVFSLSLATSPSSLSQRLTSAHLSPARSPLVPPTHLSSLFLYSSLHPPPQSLCLPSRSLSFLAGQGPCSSSSVSPLFFSRTHSLSNSHIPSLPLFLLSYSSSFLSFFLSSHICEIFHFLFFI